jgi:dTDP-4-amino-4,6-dideoxygalactose transaminase
LRAGFTPSSEAALSFNRNFGSALSRSDLPAPNATPVAKPRLPKAETLLPFLKRIDAARYYTNYGSLNAEFEARLAARVGAEAAVTVANGTLGLTLALMIQRPPPGSLCMIPAWTFAASGHAARLAGLEPWLVDVEPAGWRLTPEAAEAYLRFPPGPVGAVMPVMPFGSPTDLEEWDAFRDRTGLAVAVDAAAAFDTLKAARVPAVVSLHATKALGVGEGGFVASLETEAILDIRGRANFGFLGSRKSRETALNAKLSEYAAAVGLAALAEWPEAREDFRHVGIAYVRGMANSSVSLQPGLGDAWVTSTVVAAMPREKRTSALKRLKQAGIATRRWWGGGLHGHAAFSSCPRTRLPVTNALAATTLGLPCWRDLPEATVADACRIITTA